jgi:hypothetical protein
MKIYFLGGLHPVFETYLKYPPKGVNYISNIPLESYLESYKTIKIYQKGLPKIKKTVL